MKKVVKVIIGIFVAAVFIRAVVVMGEIEKSSIINEDTIAVLDIDGTILDSDRTIKMLKELKDNQHVKGIVIRVNSPGGAVNPSMEIYNYINKLGKKVYVAMGSVAASGGYLISLGGDRIYAEPSTVTGSIGVIMNLVNTAELTDKIGIRSVVLKTGEFKDTGSPSREMTEKDKEVLYAVLYDMYDQFVNIVASRRALSKDVVLKLADGRIYTGNMAYNEKLVNKLGSWMDAVNDMKEDLRLPDIKYYEVPKEQTTLEKILSAASQTELTKVLSSKTGFFYLADIY